MFFDTPTPSIYCSDMCALRQLQLSISKSFILAFSAQKILRQQKPWHIGITQSDNLDTFHHWYFLAYIRFLRTLLSVCCWKLSNFIFSNFYRFLEMPLIRIKNSFGAPFQFTKFIFTKGNYIGVKPRVATISRFYKVCTALQSQSILPHCLLKVNIIRGVLGQSLFPRLPLCFCRV